MKKAIINLNNFRTIGSKVFTGRSKGGEVRNTSKIDELERENSIIEIVIPTDIYSINPSFLEEFLVNVVSKLGAQGFNEKFKFINEGDYKITKDIEEAIERILRIENALI
jgi:hypothetical protein